MISIHSVINIPMTQKVEAHFKWKCAKVRCWQCISKLLGYKWDCFPHILIGGYWCPVCWQVTWSGETWTEIYVETRHSSTKFQSSTAGKMHRSIRLRLWLRWRAGCILYKRIFASSAKCKVQGKVTGWNEIGSKRRPVPPIQAPGGKIHEAAFKIYGTAPLLRRKELKEFEIVVRGHP